MSTNTWNRFTDSILEIKHIKIPIQKRFFLNFIEDDETNIQKQKILQELLLKGYLEDDPRLLQFRNNLKILVKSQSLNYEEFKYCIENHICILKQIFRSESIIPDFHTFTTHIQSIYDQSLLNTGGKNTDYIPQLDKVNPEQYGVSICTIDGQRHNIGNSSTYFSVQSCCKPINYAFALETKGEEYVHTYVGKEPSGQSFNELWKDTQ